MTLNLGTYFHLDVHYQIWKVTYSMNSTICGILNNNNYISYFPCAMCKNIKDDVNQKICYYGFLE